MICQQMLSSLQALLPFFIGHNTDTSATYLNIDLRKINDWPFLWKTSFNPDPSKQAQQVIFYCKHQKINHPFTYFNNNPIKQVMPQNHLGIKFSRTHLKYITQSKQNNWIIREAAITINQKMESSNISPLWL